MANKILYHGTRPDLVKSILRHGITSPSMGYDSPRWYMLAEDPKDADFHAYGALIEVKVPFSLKRSRTNKWPGYPYLWPASPNGWYALRRPIPPEFIVRVGRASDRR